MQLTRTLPVICLAALPSSAQTLMRTVNGPAANARYGTACIRVPDQNGDGFKDLLVGAPGFNQERGAIYCLSGAYLAFGTGTLTLWSLAPTANPGDLFGFALTDVGDVNGDSVHDFLVGQPGYDVVGVSNDRGAVRLVNGSNHTIVSRIYGYETGCCFGSALATIGDADGNGTPEVVIGAPGPNSSLSGVYMCNTADLIYTTSINSPNPTLITAPGSDGLGASIAGGFDLFNDGTPDFVVGRPGFDSGALTDAGLVSVFTGLPGHVGSWGSYVSTIAGERLGTSVGGGYDYDGDGMVDFVAGAPNSIDFTGHKGGRVVVLSGHGVANHIPPYEIYTLLPGALSHVAQLTFDTHFGAAVCASPDLNHDGVGEILVGSPDYFTGFGAARGAMTIFSGASGALWAHTFGSGDDHLGSSITGAIEDLDGDGFREFVVAGALSDAGGADSGVLNCYRLFPIAPSTYCTGKVNSLGCTPAIAFSGTPSETALQPFLITASNFVNQKNGLLFYSHVRASTAFQGGFKCAANPVRRSAVLNSGGSTSGSSCTGAYSVDFNALTQSAVDPSLAAGAEVYAQYWSRDPLSASHTSLSNAVRFLINP